MAPFLVLALVLSGRSRLYGVLLPVCLALPVLSSFYGHVATRYLSHLLPAFAVLAGVGLARTWSLLRSSSLSPWMASGLATLGLLVLVPIWAWGTLGTWQDTVREPNFERDLARSTTERMPVTRDDVLAADPEETRAFGPEVAYYLDSRLSWWYPSGPDDYPREEVFGMNPYPPDEITLRAVDAPALGRLNVEPPVSPLSPTSPDSYGTILSSVDVGSG
jgi:hypothetical protein